MQQGYKWQAMGFVTQMDNSKSQTTILALDDEAPILEMLTYALEQHGRTVLTAETASAAKVLLAERKVDLALIDWMLPGGSGIELVRSLRKQEITRQLPIIMLTARTDEPDITAGLDAGADDYMTKPFSPRELNSRINAILRRSNQYRRSQTQLTLGALILDIDAVRVEAYGVPVAMGHTEFKLLAFLMQNPERVYSRSQLLDHVWGIGTFIEERTIDVHILRLRKSLKPSGLETMLQTVRGAGYKLQEMGPE